MLTSELEGFAEIRTGIRQVVIMNYDGVSGMDITVVSLLWWLACPLQDCKSLNKG